MEAVMDEDHDLEEVNLGPLMGSQAWEDRNEQRTEGMRRNLRDLWNHLMREAYGASVMCNVA
eukprot:4280744-Heterocapsa_arctica.AAC.1